jgi:hypothetical protein
VAITLDHFEALQACQVGVLRNLEAINRGRKHRHGFNGDAWAAHIEGAAAELAVSKYLDRYWIAVVPDPSLLPGDVGERTQVRCTARANGCLIVHEDDPDDHGFILVVGAMPRFKIVGWLFGREAKHPTFWREDTGRPAYFVPQTALKPMPTRH